VNFRDPVFLHPSRSLSGLSLSPSRRSNQPQSVCPATPSSRLSRSSSGSPGIVACRAVNSRKFAALFSSLRLHAPCHPNEKNRAPFQLHLRTQVHLLRSGLELRRHYLRHIRKFSTPRVLLLYLHSLSYEERKVASTHHRRYPEPRSVVLAVVVVVVRACLRCPPTSGQGDTILYDPLSSDTHSSPWGLYGSSIDGFRPRRHSMRSRNIIVSLRG